VSSVDSNVVDVTALTERPDRRAPPRFSHEALFYDGPATFLRHVVPFVREGLEEGEAVLVAVEASKIDLLRGALNEVGAHLRFADMRKLGRNPARIIPAWHEFAADRSAAGQPYRGVGEPIWPGRGGAQLAESHLHESLLNLAFGRGPAWRLLCPYDTNRLDSSVIDEARRNHPVLVQHGRSHSSQTYREPRAVDVFHRPLPSPKGPTESIRFDARSLARIRRFLSERARTAGLEPKRATEFVFAANEIATNSVLHGGGRGTLRIWQQEGAVICEVRDAGRFSRPLVGREPPTLEQDGGRGLWLANQLCDLVQVRSFDGAAVVRLHIRVADDRAT
jgi:anti-sigma regulatory factor (Ser/Thr protein kinase)